MPALNPTTLEIDADMTGRVELLARQLERSPHDLMYEAIALYVAREEAEEFNRATVEAWEAYERDGLYVPHEAVSAWLTEFAKGGNPPLPTPCAD